MFFMKMIFICFAFVVYMGVVIVGLPYLNVLVIYVTLSFILFLSL